MGIGFLEWSPPVLTFGRATASLPRLIEKPFSSHALTVSTDSPESSNKRINIGKKRGEAHSLGFEPSYQGLPDFKTNQLHKVLVAQSCLTPCDPMHCSLPGSSVHGSLWVRILKWVAIPFFRGSSWWGIEPWAAGRFITNQATREAWMFTGRTDAEGEAQTLWLPDAKSKLIGKKKTLILGRIEGRRRSGQQRIR